MNLRALGSMPVDGSSRNTTGGLPSIAIATDSFLLLPPDSAPAGTFSNFYRSISINFFSIN